MNGWIIVAGRSGTVLVAIGLALLLVSLIPSGRTGGSSETSFPLLPRSFNAQQVGIFTPQESVHYRVTVTGNVTIYLLETSYQTLSNWVMAHNRTRDYYNATNLRNFLGNYSQTIKFQQTVIDQTITPPDYSPNQVANVTLVSSNPTTRPATVDFMFSTAAQLAPSDKVRIVGGWAVPIGLILAAPLFFNIWRTKTGRRIS